MGQVLSEIKKSIMFVVMGDFNATVSEVNGRLQCHSGWSQWRSQAYYGRHKIEPKNDNGDLLIEFCGKHVLKMGGTLFPHKERHKVAWISPDEVTQN
jgi:hypothetical protein